MTTQVERGMVKTGFALATEVSALRAIFVGSIHEFPFLPAEACWLPCYGQTLLIADYPALYAKIGTTYGGNGTTTFGLPDQRGRVSAGVDNMGGTSANRLTGQTGGLNGDTLGATGGAETHTLTEAQMPAHAHGGATASNGAHTHTLSAPSKSASGGATLNNAHYSAFDGADYGTPSRTTSSNGAHTHTIASAGSGNAHNNVQPTIAQYKCILAY